MTLSKPAEPWFDRLARLIRSELAAVAALFIVAGGVLVFIRVADAASEAEDHGFDRAVLGALRPYAEAPGRPWGPAWLHEAAADLTALGGIAVLALFALIVIGVLLIQRKYLSSVLLAAALAGGVMLSEGLKALFQRERPPVAYQAVETLNASFPSGHTLLATVFYLTVGVMLARAFPRRRFQTYVLCVAVLLALVVGLTRVYLGAHWTTDVIGGWSIGAAWAMALWLVAYGVERALAHRAGGLHDAPSEAPLSERGPTP